MTQRPLDFGRPDRLERRRQSVLRVYGAVVDELGLDAVCGACDARRSELLDALGGREGRYFRLDWQLAIYDIASPDQRARIERAHFPADRELTTEERYERLRLRVAAELGAVGLRIVEENDR